MYNTETTYTVRAILDTTGMDKTILDQVLQILLKVKLLVLDHDNSPPQAIQECMDAPSSSQSQSSSINYNSTVKYSPELCLKHNAEYRNRKPRVNINVPLRTEAKNEQKEVLKSVDDDRKYEIQCCIVRVMKSRKKLEHNVLTTEVIDQLKHRFKPKITIIKKGIDTLIDKEYLARDNEDRNLYTYLA